MNTVANVAIINIETMLSVVENSEEILSERFDQNRVSIMPAEVNNNNWMELTVQESDESYEIELTQRSREALLREAVDPDEKTSSTIMKVNKELLDQLTAIDEMAVFKLMEVYELHEGVLSKRKLDYSSLQEGGRYIDILVLAILELSQKYPIDYIFEQIEGIDKGKLKDFLEADNKFKAFKRF